jgi:hypothetical protein
MENTLPMKGEEKILYEEEGMDKLAATWKAHGFMGACMART